MQGEYYYGNNAWSYVYNQTDVNLKDLLEKIASEKGTP